MKRVELLEALYLQGKLMREAHRGLMHFLRTGNDPNGDVSEKLFARYELTTSDFDLLTKKLDDWWDESNIAKVSGATIQLPGDKLKEIHDFMVSPENSQPVEFHKYEPLNDSDDDIRI